MIYMTKATDSDKPAGDRPAHRGPIGWDYSLEGLSPPDWLTREDALRVASTIHEWEERQGFVLPLVVHLAVEFEACLRRHSEETENASKQNQPRW